MSDEKGQFVSMIYTHKFKNKISENCQQTNKFFFYNLADAFALYYSILTTRIILIKHKNPDNICLWIILERAGNYCGMLV